MKILEFIFSMADGGAETLVKDYAILLKNDGHDVVIVTLFPSYGTANQTLIEQNGIRTVSIYRDRSVFSRGAHMVCDDFIPYFRLKRILKKESPDVIHTHLNVLRYLRSLNSSFLRGIRLFYTCHNVPKYYFDGDSPDRCAAEKLIRQNNLRLVALHAEMQQELNAMFGVSDTVIIRNGVDVPRFSDVRESRLHVRSSLGIPQNAFVIGHIGRFDEQKNHTFLVDIFASLRKNNRSAFLLLIGNGRLRPCIEQKLQALGLKNSYLILEHRTDIPQLLKAMDVFVFPSLFEGLSVTLAEAQAARLRCIVSDTVNAQSLLLDTTVPLSLNASPEQWADVVLDDTARHPATGNIADYDINREIKRLEALYEGKLS